MAFQPLQWTYNPPPTVLPETPAETAAPQTLTGIGPDGLPVAGTEARKLMSRLQDLSDTAGYLSQIVKERTAGIALPVDPALHPEVAQALTRIYGGNRPPGISVPMYAHLVNAEMSAIRADIAIKASPNSTSLKVSPLERADVGTVINHFENTLTDRNDFLSHLPVLIRGLEGDRVAFDHLKVSFSKYPGADGSLPAPAPNPGIPGNILNPINPAVAAVLATADPGAVTTGAGATASASGSVDSLAASGLCNTSATAPYTVRTAGGASNFASLHAGSVIQINGSQYTVADWIDANHVNLTTSPGNLTRVSWSAAGGSGSGSSGSGSGSGTSGSGSGTGSSGSSGSGSGSILGVPIGTSYLPPSGTTTKTTGPGSAQISHTIQASLADPADATADVHPSIATGMNQRLNVWQQYYGKTYDLTTGIDSVYMDIQSLNNKFITQPVALLLKIVAMLMTLIALFHKVSLSSIRKSLVWMVIPRLMAEVGGYMTVLDRLIQKALNPALSVINSIGRLYGEVARDINQVAWLANGCLTGMLKSEISGKNQVPKPQKIKELNAIPDALKQITVGVAWSCSKLQKEQNWVKKSMFKIMDRSLGGNGDRLETLQSLRALSALISITQSIIAQLNMMSGGGVQGAQQPLGQIGMVVNGVAATGQQAIALSGTNIVLTKAPVSSPPPNVQAVLIAGNSTQINAANSFTIPVNPLSV